MTYSSDVRILSRPIPIRWAGWESNTLMLQQCGWQIAVEFNPDCDVYRLMMRHEQMNMTAMTNERVIDFAVSLSNFEHRELAKLPGFEVMQVAPRLENARITDNRSWDGFQMIDAKPQMLETKIERLEDLNIFALAVGKAEEIVIDKADMSVVDHLKAIKELQAEKQKQLREKSRQKRRDVGGERVRGEVVVQLTNYR